MLGGGTWIAQNKILAGAYINFVSAQRPTATLSDRGVATIALPLKWGKDGKVITLTSEDFIKNSRKILGFDYTSDEAKPLRDLFKNARLVYLYKLMKDGKKASNSVAEALYNGSVGAKLSTEILTGTTSGTFDVNIYYENDLVYEKTVSTLEELTADDNGWVAWTLSALQAETKTALTGTDLDGVAVTAAEHTAYLTAIEGYTFNAMACASTDDTIKDLYIQNCKSAREDAGIKFQLVVFNKAADYEGIVNVKNDANCVYWTLGAIAGCAVNASNTNKIYDGEFEFNTDYSRIDLETAIKAGEFVFHNVGDDVRVLLDINSLVTTTEQKGDDFKNNQTIRVIDQIAMDIASVFINKYLGRIPNDKSGRTSLWTDIITHHRQLETIRAIEDFDPNAVTVEQGDTKTSVVVNDIVTVTNCMEKLYMTVVVA